MRLILSILLFILFLPTVSFSLEKGAENIGYDISLTMPKGWTPLSKQLLTQAYNRTDTIANDATVHEKNSEFDSNIILFIPENGAGTRSQEKPIHQRFLGSNDTLLRINKLHG